MPDKISLKQIEKKAYLTYHQDGIWDILLGTALFWFGLTIRFDLAYLAGIWPAVLIFSVLGIKKAFTLPRLGYVQFSPKRQSHTKRGLAKMTALLSFTALLGLLTFYAFTGDADWQFFIRDLGILPFGFVITLILITVGIVFGIYRLIGYGIFVMLCFVLGHLAGTELAAIFIFPGAIFTIIGIILLINFMRKYPKKPKSQFEPFNYPK